jgi:hypothetical protein
MSDSTKVYYEQNGPPLQPGFRGGGRAWLVRPEPNRPWDEHFGEFEITEQLYWSLFNLSIIDALEQLPHDGLMGAYEEGVLLASSLNRASEILRERATNLGATDYEWDCGTQIKPVKVQYKIIVEPARLKEELLSLADFVDTAASQGYNVQLWL